MHSPSAISAHGSHSVNLLRSTFFIWYANFTQAERQELDKLNATAKERQKQKFLDGFFIDSADIPGVGPTRKSTLRSFGIETAADVDRHRIQNIRGFGQSLTRAVLDWKASCERKFTFNAATAVTDADKNAVRAKLAARKMRVESTLRQGPSDLKRMREEAILRSSNVIIQIEQSAKQLAQAKKDYSIL